MKNKLWILLLLFSFLQFSCEKIIDLPINDIEQKLIIEAVIKDQPGNNFVLLSKSESVYNDTESEKVEDAIVTLTDEDGLAIILEHTENGRYNAEDFSITPGKRYDLKVEALGQIITATCQTRTKPKIDSLSVLLLSGSYGVPKEDTLYLISFNSVDNADEKNYYWVKIFRNGNQNGGYYLGNDDLVNGQYYKAPFYGAEAKPGDSVLVEMISMDKANYDYYTGVENNINTGPFSAAPANPPSNLSGDALGIFGAFSTDTISIVLSL